MHRPGEGPTAHLRAVAVAGVLRLVSVTVARGRPLVISSQIGKLLEDRAPTESQARREVGVLGEVGSTAGLAQGTKVSSLTYPWGFCSLDPLSRCGARGVGQQGKVSVASRGCPHSRPGPPPAALG